MALTYSSMLELGTQMPKFELENTVNNQIFSTSYFNSTTPKLVMFICNHCPYVIHYHKELTKLSQDYKDHLDFVAISSNDIVNYPEDSPEKMKELAIELGFFFLIFTMRLKKLQKALKQHVRLSFICSIKKKCLNIEVDYMILVQEKA